MAKHACLIRFRLVNTTRYARSVLALTAAFALSLAAAACSPGNDDSAEDTPQATVGATAPPLTGRPLSTDVTVTTAPPTTAPPAGPPLVAELPWGNFTLAPRIADKLAAGGRLNVVVSLSTVDGGRRAAQFTEGWQRAGAEAAEQFGREINPRVIGPPVADAAEQQATIEALVVSGDIDCLAVQASEAGSFDAAINTAVEAGIPVFTVAGDAPASKRFAHVGLDAVEAGRVAGSLVGQWAVDGSILVRRAALLSGDAASQQSFDLMRGFVAGLAETHSGADWLNEPATAPSWGFDEVTVYNLAEAWTIENSDVDIVFHTDEGLEMIGRVIADQLLYGDMYAVGFGANETIANLIRERAIVAAMSPRFDEQAYLAGQACSGFLLDGVVERGHIVVAPAAYTLDNVDDLDAALSEGS